MTEERKVGLTIPEGMRTPEVDEWLRKAEVILNADPAVKAILEPDEKFATFGTSMRKMP